MQKHVQFALPDRQLQEVLHDAALESVAVQILHLPLVVELVACYELVELLCLEDISQNSDILCGVHLFVIVPFYIQGGYVCI